MTEHLNKTGILVANASVATLYLYDLKKNHLQLVFNQEHPENKMKVSEFIDNKRGNYNKPFTDGGFYEAAKSPKQVEAERFSAEISHLLNKQDSTFTHLIIFAPGHFQALIKQKISHAIQSKIKHFVDKDYTKIEEKDLKNHIIHMIKPH
jgi:protein required for attachment to host cells